MVTTHSSYFHGYVVFYMEEVVENTPCPPFLLPRVGLWMTEKAEQKTWKREFWNWGEEVKTQNIWNKVNIFPIAWEISKNV